MVRTKINAFRLSTNLDVVTWAAEAGITVQALERHLEGQDSRVTTAARLLRAAQRILARPVRASELWDLGDDEPVSKRAARRRLVAFPNAVRKQYDTPLDRLLVRERIVPSEFAREAGISRQTLRRLRADEEEPRLSMVARLVRTLRQMTGRPIRARDLYDLGEAA